MFIAYMFDSYPLPLYIWYDYVTLILVGLFLLLVVFLIPVCIWIELTLDVVFPFLTPQV